MIDETGNSPECPYDIFDTVFKFFVQFGIPNKIPLKIAVKALNVNALIFKSLII